MAKRVKLKIYMYICHESITWRKQNKESKTSNQELQSFLVYPAAHVYVKLLNSSLHELDQNIVICQWRSDQIFSKAGG